MCCLRNGPQAIQLQLPVDGSTRQTPSLISSVPTSFLGSQRPNCDPDCPASPTSHPGRRATRRRQVKRKPAAALPHRSIQRLCFRRWADRIPPKRSGGQQRRGCCWTEQPAHHIFCRILRARTASIFQGETPSPEGIIIRLGLSDANKKGSLLVALSWCQVGVCLCAPAARRLQASTVCASRPGHQQLTITFAK